jgi:hypothetical protein
LGELLERLGLLVNLQPHSEPQLCLAEFQLASIQTIESFLTYWPAAAHQAQKKLDFPASKLLPLVKPIELLLANWDVVPIDQVGTTLAFNPQQHQAIKGQVSTERKLLWRTQVSRS